VLGTIKTLIGGFLLGTTKLSFTKNSYNTKNSLFFQAVAIVVEIEDWSGKRGRFWEFLTNRFYTNQFSQKRTAPKIFNRRISKQIPIKLVRNEKTLCRKLSAIVIFFYSKKNDTASI
jgi:hypothetical protein